MYVSIIMSCTGNFTTNLCENWIRFWTQKRTVWKRVLLSLIGKLLHAAKIIVPGCTFLRRMIDTACKAKHPDHWIHLSSEFCFDLAWWHCFLKSWNGRSMMKLIAPHSNPHAMVITDALGSWGCGAFWIESCRWLQRAWPIAWKNVPMHCKELLPFILAAATWGPHWQFSHILVHCDNMAVVNMIASGTSKDKLAMHLLRSLHFVCAMYQVSIRVVHLAGSHNVIADAISRNLMQVFFYHAPKAEKTPTPIPEPIWEVLVTHQPDWLSTTWQRSLTDSLTIAWHQAHERCTHLHKQGTCLSVPT